MPFSLENKVIVVTGASSGIGRQCAISCSNSGAKVILIGRNEERLQETVSKMQHPENHLLCKIDLTTDQGIDSILESAVSKLGKISGLINAAGISVTYPFRVLDQAKIEATFKVNVFASMNLAKSVCRTKVRSKEGTSIVFITSVMGMVGEAGKSLYGMSKGALLAGAKSLAVEYAAKNIRFNCISPGVVVTPMSNNSIYSKNESALEKIKSFHPMGLGEPSDVANGAIYLLSDAAKWVTGTNLVIDGGYTAR